METSASSGERARPSRSDQQPRTNGLAERRRALRDVRRWAPVIGAEVLEDPSGYDLVAIDGLAGAGGDGSVARARLATARASGALVLSYISVGTVEGWRSYAPEVPASWTLGPVPGWPQERYVDARERGWQAIMAREAAALATAGFDGLYLDNLDVGHDFPQTQLGLVELVDGLRAAVPDLLLVAQNGLAVVDRLPVDGISHEDTWWRWDDGYRRSPENETLAGLRRQRERGLPVFTLDYTEPGSPAAGETVTRSLGEGFCPAVSVLDLDRLPHAPPRDRARRGAGSNR
jgi:cysteinyl-tRNA synthetase